MAVRGLGSRDVAATAAAGSLTAEDFLFPGDWDLAEVDFLPVSVGVGGEVPSAAAGKGSWVSSSATCSSNASLSSLCHHDVIVHDNITTAISMLGRQ